MSPLPNAADPLRALIGTIREEAARLDTSKEESADDERFCGLRELLGEHTPPCSSAEGAIDALRFIADDLENSFSEMQVSVMRSVLAYVEAQA